MKISSLFFKTFAQLKTEWKTTKKRIFRPQIMLSSYV